MRDAGMRKRVERLIAGLFQPGDLDRLYLHLRERSYGSVLVRELADFIAHPGARDRGPTTDEVRDFFTVLRYVVPLLGSGGPGLDLNDIPATILPGYRANFRRIGPAGIKRETGLGQKAAKAALESGLGKLTEGASAGRLRLTGYLTKEEVSVLQCCGRHVTAHAAFTGNDLFNDLRAALEKNKLLQANERAQFNHLKTAVMLHAVAAIHGTKILLEDQSTADLFGIIHDGFVEINARAGVTSAQGTIISFVGRMFDTGLTAAQHCDPRLIQEHTPWSGPIELTADRRLVPI